jgi:putative DNA primase/helicase
MDDGSFNDGRGNSQGGGAEPGGAGRQDFEAQFDHAEQIKPKTVEELVEEVDQFNRYTSAGEINTIIREAIRARVSTLEKGIIITRLKEKTKQSKGVLAQAWLEIQKPGTKEKRDIGAETYKAVLDRYFAAGEHLVRARQQFWAWMGTHWSRRDDEHIAEIVSRELLENPPDISDTATALGKTMTIMKSSRVKQTDVFKFAEPPEPIIVVQNGELYLREDGEVTFTPGHNPESYQTCCLSVVYDPEAQCPMYDKALLEIFSGDAEIVRHWHEFVGYGIQPVRNIASIWMLYGHGKNGKTQLVKTIKKLMGKDAVASIRVGSLSGDFGLEPLIGRRWALDDDVDQNTLLPDGTLKLISEVKDITVARKGIKSLDVICYALVVMLANDWPATKDVSRGLLRRIQCFPFREAFEQNEDKTLFDRIIKQELAGVLNRALEGYQRLRARGDFDPPQACLDAKEEWLTSASSVKGFMAEEYEYRIGSRLLRTASYKHYCSWIQDSKLQPVSRVKFVKMMKHLGVLDVKIQGQFYWADVGLIDASAAAGRPGYVWG